MSLLLRSLVFGGIAALFVGQSALAQVNVRPAPARPQVQQRVQQPAPDEDPDDEDVSAPAKRPAAAKQPPAAAKALPDNAPAKTDKADSDAGVPALDDLSVTRERPLFSSTRKPPEVEPTPDAPVAITEAKSMPFELVGIVAGEELSAAIFRNTDSKEEIRVAKGDKIGGWNLEDITNRSVVLRGNDKRVRMRLFDEGKAPGVQVGRAGGEPADDPKPDDDQDKVDEEIAPNASPQAKPATAQIKPPPSLNRQANRPDRRPRRPQRPQPRGDD